MRLQGVKNGLLATEERDFKSIISYIVQLVDVYSSLEVEREYWLAEKEKEFFALVALAWSRGWHPQHPKAYDLYNDMLFKCEGKHKLSTKVSQYLGKIRRKHWWNIPWIS